MTGRATYISFLTGLVLLGACASEPPLAPTTLPTDAYPVASAPVAPEATAASEPVSVSGVSSETETASALVVPPLPEPDALPESTLPVPEPQIAVLPAPNVPAPALQPTASIPAPITSIATQRLQPEATPPVLVSQPQTPRPAPAASQGAGFTWQTKTEAEMTLPIEIRSLTPGHFPTGSRVTLQIYDFLLADTNSIVSTEIYTTQPGDALPLALSMVLDPAAMTALAGPALGVQIHAPDGRLLYVTDTAFPIKDRSADGVLRVAVIPVL